MVQDVLSGFYGELGALLTVKKLKLLFSLSFSHKVEKILLKSFNLEMHKNYRQTLSWKLFRFFGGAKNGNHPEVDRTHALITHRWFSNKNVGRENDSLKRQLW